MIFLCGVAKTGEEKETGDMTHDRPNREKLLQPRILKQSSKTFRLKHNCLQQPLTSELVFKERWVKAVESKQVLKEGTGTKWLMSEMF